MENNSFKLSFKVSGTERKVVAAVIAAAQSTGVTYTYAGSPTFSYEAGGWIIDREGTVTTPETPVDKKESLRTVLSAINTAGAMVEGNASLTISLEDHTGNSLRNLVNLIYSKESLIRKSLSFQDDIIPETLVTALNSVPIDTLEEFADTVNTAIDNGQIQGESYLDFDLAEKTISFSFANATLDTDEVFAFITLCWQLSEKAKLQKFSSSRQKETPNDRYAFRCFLLKLKFIGVGFANERKVLLARLTGDGAFCTEEAKQAAKEKRKGKAAPANEN